MKGSVYKATSKAGRTTWRYQVDAGRDESGNRIRLGESGFKLERQAYDAMRAAMQRQAGHRMGTAATFKQFMEQWLPYHEKAKPLAPKTAERYRSLAAHATRSLGTVPLKDLTAFMFDDLYSSLVQQLSAKTVREVHNVVHVALKRAVKTKLIPANPADGCDLPRMDQREASSLSPDQLARLQAAAAGTWVDLLIRLASAIGARRGELLALKWSDFDWAKGKLRIERSLYQIKGEIGLKATKTRQVRTVSVPPSLTDYLRLHFESQCQHRASFGSGYREDLDLIFADPAGDYLVPSSITRAVVRIAGTAGLERVGLHTLRHTHASILLHAGVAITNVSKRLGHRDAYTTAKVYAHALPDSDHDVASMWDKQTARVNKEMPQAQNGTTGAPDSVVKQ